MCCLEAVYQIFQNLPKIVQLPLWADDWGWDGVGRPPRTRRPRKRRSPANDAGWSQPSLWETCDGLACKHCGNVRTRYRRGLCMTCYADLTVREQYPQLIPLSEGAEDLVAGRELLRAAPAPGKLMSLPETPERVEELASRYQHRQELFSVEDVLVPPVVSTENGSASKPATTLDPLRRRASAAFKTWQGRRVQDFAAVGADED